MPPKRGSVRAGRRVAKPKAAKGKRAKVAKAGNRAKAARKPAKPAQVKPVTKAVAARKPAKPAKVEVQSSPKAAQPAKVAPTKTVFPRASHDDKAKDSKKALPVERTTDRAPGVPASGGHHEAPSSAERAGGPAVQPALPIPIASFTI